MDPKRPNIQSSWIHKKPVPLHSARRANSGGIFGFENGVSMRELPQSEVMYKQQKIN
jgi:hypothetical protein